MSIKDCFSKSLSEHLEVVLQLNLCLPDFLRLAETALEVVNSGGKIMICGNGGSAADAQHIAAELVGRFQRERSPIPAIALTTDSSILTAISNDYDYTSVFARQVDALGLSGDLLLVISTSGNSENIVKAIQVAKNKSIYVSALLGGTGGLVGDIADNRVIVPSSNTPRIQEAHILLGHILCQLFDLIDIE